jgi:hypothetical protein
MAGKVAVRWFVNTWKLKSGTDRPFFIIIDPHESLPIRSKPTTIVIVLDSNQYSLSSGGSKNKQIFQHRH